MFVVSLQENYSVKRGIWLASRESRRRMPLPARCRRRTHLVKEHVFPVTTEGGKVFKHAIRTNTML